MRSVCITGATGDLGKAMARIFLQHDFFVFCHGSSAQSDFSLTQEFPHQTKALIADFSDLAAISTMFSEIQTLDILINNAGLLLRESSESPERFEMLLRVNALAPYSCSEHARKKGVFSILNIGSLRGLPEYARIPDYSASKAALHTLTTALAKKYAPSIRVNALIPGFIKTKMHASSQERLLQEEENTLLHRTASPEEIAKMAFFIATEASFMTGALIRIDGGRMGV